MNTEAGVNNSGENEQEVTGAPDSTNDKSQVAEESRGFTQEEVDRIVQARLEKYKKRYQEIDVDEYKSLKSAQEERELESLKKREEFEKVLMKQKDKFSSEIESLRAELTAVKVDGTILSAASSRNAVNPDQVAQLLKNSVGLDTSGRPVVYDKEGSIVYDDKTAEPKSIESFVNEFLDNNPHFVRSGPSGVASSGAKGPNTRSEMDPTSLDMSNPEDRERYKKWRASQGY